MITATVASFRRQDVTCGLSEALHNEAHNNRHMSLRLQAARADWAVVGVGLTFLASP
jgi:hypothetical protein